MNIRLTLIVSCLAVVALGTAHTQDNLFASINGTQKNGTGSIFQFTPGGAQSTFPSGLDLPRGLAFDSAGDLFVDTTFINSTSGLLQGSILKFTSGGAESTFATVGPGNFLQGLALDSAGNVFVTLQSQTSLASTIDKITPSGAITTFASSPDQLFGLAFNKGNLFVADSSGSKILKFTPGGTQSTFATVSSSINPAGLAFDSAGNLFVSTEAATPGNDTILKLTPGGVESTFATGLSTPRGLAFDGAGNLFVAEFPLPTTGDILKFTPGGTESVFASGLSGPTWLAFQPTVWGASPATGDWNTPGNWNPATVPNGPTATATFGQSNTRSVSISANTEVNGIVFNSGANAFTITASPTLTLTISGVGITNNSGVTQNFVTGVDSSGNFGTISFTNGATAGSMTVITNQGGTNGSAPNGGLTEFNNSSTAGSSTISNNGGAASGATIFFDSSTAGSATITNNAATGAGTFGGLINFNNTSSAGSATIINNGSTLSADGTNGATIFLDSSTAAAATLIANGGTGGGSGGRINFDANSDGGTARVEVFGNGKLDISGHNAPGVTIGSIEGDGNAFLGANNLTVGSNNLSTTLSGVIQDGGFFGGTGGSLTKIGTGTLTLSGVNTYTGPTTIDAGVLNVTGSITSAVTVNGGGTLGTTQSLALTSGGTLSGGGTTGSVTVNSGGIVAPTGQKREAPPPIPGLSATGNAVASASFGALHVNGDYLQNAGGTLLLAIAGATPGSFDQLIVSGKITLETGAILELDFLNGFAPTKGEVFDLLSSGISSITGTFTTVNLEGLAPGFEFDLAGSNGTFDLTALNNGVPTSTSVPDTSSTAMLLTFSITALFGLKLLLGQRARSMLRSP